MCVLGHIVTTRRSRFLVAVVGNTPLRRSHRPHGTHSGEMRGRVPALKDEMRSGSVHPPVASPALRTVADGRGFSPILDEDFSREGWRHLGKTAAIVWFLLETLPSPPSDVLVTLSALHHLGRIHCHVRGTEAAFPVRRCSPIPLGRFRFHEDGPRVF